MDDRTGTAILLAIVAAGIYRIVVFRRLLNRLDARALAVRGADGVALDPTIAAPDPA